MTHLVGVLVANCLIMAALAVGQLMRDEEFVYRDAVSWLVLAIAAITLAFLPFHMKKRSVSAEIRYRRQHGKWRWEH